MAQDARGCMTKIALLYAWHDDNRGDAALVATAMRLAIRRSGASEVVVVPITYVSESEAGVAFRHLRREFPNVILRSNPACLFLSGSLIRDMGSAVAVLLAWLAWRLLGQSGWRPYKGILRDVDVVYTVGGHYWFTLDAGVRSLLRVLRLCLPLLEAQLKGCETVHLSQTFGPFHGEICRWAVRTTFRHSKQILCRETQSLAVMKNLLGDTARANALRLLPDTAFLLTPGDRRALERALPNDYFVITVRGAFGREVSHEWSEKIIDALDLLVGRISERLPTSRPVIVAQVTGPTGVEDDREISRSLANRIGRFEPLQIIDHDLDYRALLSVYAGARFVVGTRFHSVIFALTQYVPVVAMSYFGTKAKGIMTDLGLGEFVVEGASPDWSDLCEKVELVLARHEELGAHISDCASKYRHQLEAWAQG